MNAPATGTVEGIIATTCGSLPKSLADPVRMSEARNQLVSAENWCGAAIIATGGGFMHEARWRAERAVEHLLTFIASTDAPSPREECVSGKDDEIRRLRQRAQRMERELLEATAVLNSIGYEKHGFGWGIVIVEESTL